MRLLADGVSFSYYLQGQRAQRMETGNRRLSMFAIPEVIACC